MYYWRVANHFKLKLVHKGLIFISVPLFVQLALVAGLYHLNEEAELAAAKAKAAGIEVENVQEVVREALELSKLLDGQALSKPGFDVLSYKRRVDSVSEKANALLRETEIGGEHRKALEDLVENLNNLKGMMTELLRVYLTRPQDIDAYTYKLRKKITAYYVDGGMSNLIGIVRENRAVLEAVPKEQAQTRSETKAILIALVLLNVFVTIFLAIFFTRNIARRVMVLAENSQRIEHAKPLVDPMKGGDEIAEVDQVFHQLAARLALVEKARRSLLAMFTHDLRTPLANIMLIIDSIEDGQYGSLTEEGTGNLHIAQKSGRRMMQMMTDLLELDKMRLGQLPLHKVELSVRDLLLEAAELTTPIARENGIQIVLGQVSNSLEIYADYDRAIQIVLNLLSNAVKASPRDTTVTMEATDEQKMVRISIIDEGKGVNPDMAEKIFETYKQSTKEDEKRGFGLGLAICKELVSLHGGSMNCETNKSQGTTFSFTMPKPTES